MCVPDASCFHRLRLFFTITLIAGALSFPLHAQKTEWVLSAAEFSGEDLPEMHSQLKALIPRLLIDRLSSLSSRAVNASEQAARAASELIDNRVKLINERRVLLENRDKLLFSTNSPWNISQTRRRLNREIAEKEKRISLLTSDIAGISIENSAVGETIMPISFWKSAAELFIIPAGSNRNSALRQAGIAALITGTVADSSGYLIITCRLELSTPGIESRSIIAAASYDSIDELVKSVALELMPEIMRMPTASLTFALNPADALVSMNGKALFDLAGTHTVPAGKHLFTISAAGYQNAELETELAPDGAYLLRCELLNRSTAEVTISTTEGEAAVYYNAADYALTPVTLTVPSLPTIGELKGEGGTTYFIIDPSRGRSLAVRQNLVDTSERIEKQRRVLYNSLGALYASLPVSMLTYGIRTNKLDAYQSGRMANTSENYNSVVAWNNASLVTQGISLALGINLCIQITRYLLAAEQAVPQTAASAGE